MIGALGLFALWALGVWRGWPLALRYGALVLGWLGLVIGTTPQFDAPALAPWLGGDFRFWVLLGPVAALALAYRAGLRWLRARARPAAVPEPQAPFTPAEVSRYSRHLLLHEIGGQGQQRLKTARVLVVGAGGLGAPALMYLAAAGVGRITLIDADMVEPSNLQRQIIHTEARIGQPKVLSAAAAMAALNPHVTVVPVQARLDNSNAQSLIAEQDLVLDGTDSFDTRYLVNRTCAALGKPLIAAALTQWEGQISLFDPARGGPCYECVFPTRPAPGLVAPCAEAGVAAPLPGILGAMMAAEAIKHLTGAGETLRGRLVIHDALYAESRSITIARRAGCAGCGG